MRLPNYMKPASAKSRCTYARTRRCCAARVRWDSRPWCRRTTTSTPCSIRRRAPTSPICRPSSTPCSAFPPLFSTARGCSWASRRTSLPRHGFQVEQWQAVTASARRRKWFYDGKNTLAVFIASVSDTDDIVPTLVALQIEWNKFHWLLNADPTTMQLLESRVDRVLAGLRRDHQGRARAPAGLHGRLAAPGSHLGRQRLDQPAGHRPRAQELCPAHARRLARRLCPRHTQVVGAGQASCWTMCVWDAARSTSSPATRTASPICSPAPSCGVRTS